MDPFQAFAKEPARDTQDLLVDLYDEPSSERHHECSVPHSPHPMSEMTSLGVNASLSFSAAPSAGMTSRLVQAATISPCKGASSQPPKPRYSEAPVVCSQTYSHTGHQDNTPLQPSNGLCNAGDTQLSQIPQTQQQRCQASAEPSSSRTEHAKAEEASLKLASQIKEREADPYVMGRIAGDDRSRSSKLEEDEMDEQSLGVAETQLINYDATQVGDHNLGLEEHAKFLAPDGVAAVGTNVVPDTCSKHHHTLLKDICASQVGEGGTATAQIGHADEEQKGACSGTSLEEPDTQQRLLVDDTACGTESLRWASDAEDETQCQEEPGTPQLECEPDPDGSDGEDFILGTQPAPRDARDPSPLRSGRRSIADVAAHSTAAGHGSNMASDGANVQHSVAHDQNAGGPQKRVLV